MEVSKGSAPPPVKEKKPKLNEFAKSWKGKGTRKGKLNIDWPTALQSLDVPAFIDYDEKSHKLVCKDQSFMRLLSVATNGDPKWLKAFFRQGGKFRRKILSDTDGRMRMLLLANAMQRAMDGDMKWSEHAMRIIEQFDATAADKKNLDRAVAKIRRAAKKTEEEREIPRGLQNLG